MKTKLFILISVCSIVCNYGVAGGKQFTVEDIFSSQKFSSKSVRGVQWMKDGKSYSFSEYDTTTKSTAIYQYIVKDKSKKLVVNGTMLKLDEKDPAFKFSSYQWSPDEKQMLFVSAPP